MNKRWGKSNFYKGLSIWNVPWESLFQVKSGWGSSFAQRILVLRVASQYRCQFDVKMIVRKCQVRHDHTDAHYSSAVFRYMTAFAVHFRQYFVFASLDDKHWIKIPWSIHFMWNVVSYCFINCLLEFFQLVDRSRVRITVLCHIQHAMSSASTFARHDLYSWQRS